MSEQSYHCRHIRVVANEFVDHLLTRHHLEIELADGEDLVTKLRGRQLSHLEEGGE